MANVKHNKDVKSEQDLQNLVIGIIFRMDKPFTDKETVSLVNHYLKGSIFYNNIPLIKQHVSNSLDYYKIGILCDATMEYAI